MRTFVLLSIFAILLPACGKKDEASFTTAGEQTCSISENVMICPDGSEYLLPDDVTIDIDLVYVDTVPADEDDPEALCEKDNRNGLKCKKIKGGKK